MESTTVRVGRASEIAQKGVALISNGKVRNHKLGDSSRIHTGEVEKKEYQNYRDFLPGKNCCTIYELTGSDKIPKMRCTSH